MKNRNHKNILQYDQYSNSEVSGVNSMDSRSFISNDSDPQQQNLQQKQQIQQQHYLNNQNHNDYTPDITPDVSEDDYKQGQDYTPDITPNISRDDDDDYGPDITPNISKGNLQQYDDDYGPDITPDISRDNIKQYDDDYGPDITPNISKGNLQQYDDDYGPDITPDISRGNIPKYEDDYGPDITPDISDDDYQNNNQLLGDLDEGGLVNTHHNNKNQDQRNLELDMSSTFDVNQQNLNQKNSQKNLEDPNDQQKKTNISQSFLKKNKSGRESLTNLRQSMKKMREQNQQKDEYNFKQNSENKNLDKEIFQPEFGQKNQQNQFKKSIEIKVNQPGKIDIIDDTIQDDLLRKSQEIQNDKSPQFRTSVNNLKLPKKQIKKRSLSKKPFQRKELSPKNLKDIKKLRKLKKQQGSGEDNKQMNLSGKEWSVNKSKDDQQESPKNENIKLIKQRPKGKLMIDDLEKQEDQIIEDNNNELVKNQIDKEDDDFLQEDQNFQKNKIQIDDDINIDQIEDQNKHDSNKEDFIQEQKIEQQQEDINVEQIDNQLIDSKVTNEQQDKQENFLVEKNQKLKQNENEKELKNIQNDLNEEVIDQPIDVFEKTDDQNLKKKKKDLQNKKIEQLQQPKVEQPIEVQSIEEQPQEKQPKQEQPQEEQPIKQQSINEQTIKEQPLKVQPMEEQPIKEQSIKEQPLKIQPMEEQPIKEQSIKEQPIVEDNKIKHEDKKQTQQKDLKIEKNDIKNQDKKIIDTKEEEQLNNKEKVEEQKQDQQKDETLMTFDFDKPKKKKPKLNSKFKKKPKQNDEQNEDEILVSKKKPVNKVEEEVQNIEDKIEIALPKKNSSTKLEKQINQKAQTKKNQSPQKQEVIQEIDKPIQNKQDEQSINTKPKIIEDQPIKNTNQKVIDEPIKKSKINNIQMDEQPIKPAKQIPQEQSLPTEQPTEQPPEQPINNKPNPFSAEALANHPDAFPADELDPNKANLEDLGEIPDNLETRLKSREFKQRMEAYKELAKWEDQDLTAEIFFKTLHLTIKEKHQKVIPLMLKAITSALENPDKKEEALNVLNLPKFINTFCEHTINNAKKPTAKKSVKQFIGKFYDAVEDKSAIIDEIKNSGKSFSPKVQEPVLVLIEELLKQDKIKEMDVIMSLTELVGKLAGSRSKKIVNTAMNVIKEMALYFGEGVKDFFKELKKEQAKEISDYLKDLDPKKMKALGGGDDDGQDIQTKLYDLAKEQDLPAEYADDQFVDALLDMPKWKDKQTEIQKLSAALKPIQKLNPKTKIFHIVTLVKQMFQQSIVILQVESLKPIQFLANSLRKNMKHEAKDVFDTMMKNFQTRTRNLNDEITKTSLKLFNCFDFNDIYDLLKTSLKKTKSNFKKFNIISLIKNIVDKTNQINKGELAAKVVKLVLPDIEFNDNKVREKVAQIIAKMKDKYNDKVQPLLSDLNPQKMKIILKFCTNPMFKQDDKDKGGEQEQEQGDKPKDGDQQTQIGKTKSQKIANMRENIFSNKTYKLSDTTNFAKYLEVNLKNLADITKDFKEVNSNSAKEIYILIEEISKKVSKQAFTQISREIIAKFYIELITQKYSDEIYDSIQEYLTSKNKIITTRVFLNDLFDVISMKNIKVTRDLLSTIIKLMIDKLRKKGNLNSISHKNFIDFLKNNFASQTLHASVKTIIVNLMRIIQKKYGERALGDYPGSILKDFETQNKEIEKNFNRTLEKLNDKSEDKRNAALNEIANFKDIAKIVLFWSAKPFQQYLKTTLQDTTKEDTFRVLTMIVGSYLELYEKSRNEFSIKNYLYVFQVIIKRYYDQNLDQNKSSIDQIFLKSVEILSPTMILNNMVSDSNAINWKEEIFHFYLQYGSEINIKVKFINFIVQVISNTRNNQGELKTLIDNVLLMLKSIDNDEIIIKGNENKLIREVWQKKEEDVLFEERFVKSYKVFEDISFFNSAKIFIDQSLHFQNYEFFDKDITQIVLETNDSQLKIKLAYYYLRSIENISFINEHIFNQIAQLDSNLQKKENLYIILKILFNLLRNNAAAHEEVFYMDVKDYFTQYFNQNGETPEEVQKNLSLTGYDYRFLTVILQNLEDQQIERSYIGSPREQHYNSLNDTSNYNPQTPGPYRRGLDEDTSYIQGNMNDNVSNNTPIQFGKNKMNSQYISQLSIHPRENSPNRSKASYGTNGRSQQPRFQTPRIDNEGTQELHDQIQNMLTFNFENFQLANKYFEREMQNNKVFLCQHSKFIIENFISILIEVFGDGINFDVTRENYQLIFNPLQVFCSDKEFLNSLDQDVANSFIREILCRLVDANEQKNYIQKFPDQAYQEEDDVEDSLSPLEKAELASFLMKQFNSLMLKVIGRLQINVLITSLFTFIYECLKTECVEPNQQLYDLAFKCLLKIFKDFKKYSNQLDPRILFSLLAEFLDTYDPQSGYKDSIKTIQMMLTKVMQNNQIDNIIQCYHDVFGDHTVGLIWDLIMYYKQSQQQQQPMISPQEAHERLMEKIQIINSQNDVSQLEFFANQIGQLLAMCPQINFLNYANQFADGNFFEYLANQFGLNRNMSNMNSIQNSRSNLYNDQSFMTSQNVSRF